MENPFFYGEEVSGAFFTDRLQETEDLVRDLSRGQNIILYSPRRYGKTSLIKKVLAILSKKGCQVYYVNLYAATSKQKFIEIYARAIARGTVLGGLEKAINLLRNLLPNLIPKVVIKPQGQPEIEFDYGRKTKSLSPILNDLYEAIEKYACQKKKKAIVVFDEFQEIINLEDDEIERSLREYVQSQKQTTYVFMGSKKHLMGELFNNVNRPFYKSGRIFPLNRIGFNDFALFIKQSFLAAKIAISDELIKEILSLTDCHPYYTQMLCSIFWDRNLGKEHIPKNAVDLAKDEAIARESSNYAVIWDSIPRKRKLLLEALAKSGGENIFSQDFIAQYNLGTPTVVQKGIKSLLDKEIIDKENGRIIFTDIFFKHWILSKMST